MAAKHAEVIFETGSKSVISYDDEQELKDFVAEHVRRAKSGEVGGPSGHPAERVSKVLLYDRHPDEYAVAGVLYVTAVESLIDGLKETTSDGKEVINVWSLILALRGDISPTVTGDVGPHDSMYKMPHSGELDLTGLGV